MAYHPFRNLGLKFLSTCIAAMLWLVVAGERVVERVMQLEPELLLPGHFEPLRGRDAIRDLLDRTARAIRSVHDATVAGMNAGKDVWTLMREVKLPPELGISEQYGRVAWGVRAIYEMYTGWFRYESTSELFERPVQVVYPELAELAGGPAVLATRAQAHLAAQRPLEARALALGEAQAQTHGIGNGEDVAEQNRCVERVAIEWLQSHLGGEVHIRRQPHEAAGLGAHRPVFGEVAPGLAHQPHRGVRRGFAKTRAQEGVVERRSVHSKDYGLDIFGIALAHCPTRRVGAGAALRYRRAPGRPARPGPIHCSGCRNESNEVRVACRPVGRSEPDRLRGDRGRPCASREGRGCGGTARSGRARGGGSAGERCAYCRSG